MGLLSLTSRDMQRAKSEVTVGHQWSYTQLVGEGESSPVVDCGLLALRRITPRGNLAEEAQSICQVAAFSVLTGERQRTLGKGVCHLQAPPQPTGSNQVEDLDGHR